MPRQTADQDDLIAQAVGQAIAAQRETAKYTQEQLAEAIGVGVQQLSRFERGAVTPSVQRLYQIADALGCRIDELLMSSSKRQLDQEAVLAQELSGLESSDRDVIAAVTRTLATHMRGRMKKRAR